MVERSSRAGHLPDPGEDGLRRVHRQTHRRGRVDWALGHAAVHQRFGEGDLTSILAAHVDPTATPGPAGRRAGEQQQSLTQGTGGWAALGANDNNIAATGGGGSESVSGAATINFHDQQKDI